MKYQLRKSHQTLPSLNTDIKQKSKIFSTLQSHLLQLFWSHCTCFYGNHINHDSGGKKTGKKDTFCEKLNLLKKLKPDVVYVKYCHHQINLFKINIDHYMGEQVADNLVAKQYFALQFFFFAFFFI